MSSQLALYLVTITASVVQGLVTVGLLAITKELQLPTSLTLWPSSVGSPDTASALLPAGSVADTISLQWVEIVGSFASGALMVGRRLGWYISGGITLFVSVLGLWARPSNTSPKNRKMGRLSGLRTRIDWADAGLGPAFMALLCYLLAIPRANPSDIKSAESFSSICDTVALSNGDSNAMELFAILFRRLRAPTPPFWIVTAASAVCAGSPLLMAVFHPFTQYWTRAFVAQVLQPISFGALYTVGLTVPLPMALGKDTQALAGAVFSTASQVGNALGLAVLQVIPTIDSDGAGDRNKEENKKALKYGCCASFLIMFGSMVLCAVVGPKQD
ncbi:hypothetical protein BDV10DRAFT_195812 [Aspergillus recurvatus]